MTTEPKYLTADELVELLDFSVSTKTLANWRCDPREPGPRFLRFGNRIRYPRDEAEQWLKGRLHGSTVEYAGQQDQRRASRSEEAAERAALEQRRDVLMLELTALEQRLSAGDGARAKPTFEEKLAARPEAFGGYDMRPGSPDLGADYLASVMPPHVMVAVRRAQAAKAKKRAAAKVGQPLDTKAAAPVMSEPPAKPAMVKRGRPSRSRRRER